MARLKAPCSFNGYARARLERDAQQGRHPARNRTFALYQEVKARAEPLTLPRLVLDTGRTPLDECVRLCLAYLGEGGRGAVTRP